MAEETLASLLKRFLADRGFRELSSYRVMSRRGGLDDQAIERILSGKTKRPSRAKLLRIVETLRLEQHERNALEAASHHSETHPGFLTVTRAERVPAPGQEPALGPGRVREGPMWMQRGVILLTAFGDPSDLIKEYTKKSGPWGNVAWRSGVVFGPYDVVVRATTPKGKSVMDFAEQLFEDGEDPDERWMVRTIETIPLRDDMPFYLDPAPSHDHLTPNCVWATIFIQALGGERQPEFPQLFYERANQPDFWGGVHFLTGAVTIGQYDSVVEIIAGNVNILKEYVRAAQKHAATKPYDRHAHTITYYTHQPDLRQGATPATF
ncbi:MAG TPA: helix-turn-helix transcriptional regulator [Thermoleophilaceae bacterium]|jgi:hypothetical protein